MILPLWNGAIKRKRTSRAALLLSACLLVLTPAPRTASAEYAPPADRVAPWKGNVGVTYQGGIPARTKICATIDSAKYGKGEADATAAINEAIASCPNGETVLIPAGTYRIDNSVVIPKNKSITVRGAGPGVTIIQSANTKSDLNSAAIVVGDFPRKSFGVYTSPNYCPQTKAPAGTVQDITGGAGRGSTRITLADTGQIEVGDLGIINVLDNNDPDADWWIQTTNIGQEKNSSIYGFCCSSPETCRSLGQVVEVTAKDGKSITITPPLYTDYGKLSKPQFTRVSASDVVKNTGIEDLTVENIAGDGGVNSIISILCSYKVWLKNIETSGARGRHVWIRYISLFNEVRDSYFHTSLAFASNNYGVTVEQWTSGWLVENNRFNETMVPIMIGTTASGGVAGYNYLHIVRYTVSLGWLIQGVGQHASGAWMNLAEGNYLTKISLDEIHGTNYYFTAFRNYVRYDAPPDDGHKKNNAVNLEIARGTRLHTFAGNVLGYPGFPWRYEWNGEPCTRSGNAIYKLGYNAGSDCNPDTWDPKTASTLLRHGNYDYSHKAVVWNGKDDRKLPPSLYLASKPAWWGPLPWPPIGPDLSPMVSSIPARDRHLGLKPKRPSAPRLKSVK